MHDGQPTTRLRRQRQRQRMARGRRTLSQTTTCTIHPNASLLLLLQKVGRPRLRPAQLARRPFPTAFRLRTLIQTPGRARTVYNAHASGIARNRVQMEVTLKMHLQRSRADGY